MPTSTQEKILERHRSIIEKLRKGQAVSGKEIAGKFKVSPKTVQKDMKLWENVLPWVDSTALYALWEGTCIGGRLKNPKATDSRKRLAKEVVNFLADKGDKIRKLILGTGANAYETTVEILTRKEDLSITDIYTTNLLVVPTFASHKERDITLHVVGGRLYADTASLIVSPENVKYLADLQADAIVTSFYALCKKGFHTLFRDEVDEKLVNLCPNKKCLWVIIPMGWSKIGPAEDTALVPNEERAQGVLDFVGGERHYIIVTDPPQHMSESESIEKNGILDHWKEKGKLEKEGEKVNLVEVREV